MNADELDSLTERVLGAVFEVTNTLGAGFLEKVYQRALLRELGLRGIRACRRSLVYSHLQGPPRHCHQHFKPIAPYLQLLTALRPRISRSAVLQ
jgi:hypothetical protein